MKRSRSTGLTGHLASPVLKAAVSDVWRKLPEEDRAVLNALRTMVYEARLSEHLGLTTIRRIKGEDRRVVILDSRIDSTDLASKVFAHECAHVVLRHVDAGLGFNDVARFSFMEAEQFAEWAEKQADWLATRWGFPPPARNGQGKTGGSE